MRSIGTGKGKEGDTSTGGGPPPAPAQFRCPTAPCLPSGQTSIPVTNPFTCNTVHADPLLLPPPLPGPPTGGQVVDIFRPTGLKGDTLELAEREEAEQAAAEAAAAAAALMGPGPGPEEGPASTPLLSRIMMMPFASRRHHNHHGDGSVQGRWVGGWVHAMPGAGVPGVCRCSLAGTRAARVALAVPPSSAPRSRSVGSTACWQPPNR